MISFIELCLFNAFSGYRNLSRSLTAATQVSHVTAQSSRFLAALCISIILGNLVDLKESMIVSCNIKVQLRRFERIRKCQNPKLEEIQLCSVQRETGKISEPQGRFKTDNRDRKGANKFKSKGSTIKRKFDTGTHVTLNESSYTTLSKLEGVFVKDSLSQAQKRNLIKKHKPRRPPLMRIRDLKQGRKLHTHALTKEKSRCGGFRSERKIIV
ncbi:hypothetical protein M9H77_06313 [Catharanthus roseus]|uniref:Uncharacterized protein n=1 Tax=Catharanthus roseus TaxID=4058 RepID=A0ACC0BRY1_CATRO|nr:hypothetical protein M9H77_06313 [Catharanthus roseus]